MPLLAPGSRCGSGALRFTPPLCRCFGGRLSPSSAPPVRGLRVFRAESRKDLRKLLSWHADCSAGEHTPPRGRRDPASPTCRSSASRPRSAGWRPQRRCPATPPRRAGLSPRRPRATAPHAGPGVPMPSSDTMSAGRHRPHTSRRAPAPPPSVRCRQPPRWRPARRTTGSVADAPSESGQGLPGRHGAGRWCCRSPSLGAPSRARAAPAGFHAAGGGAP